MDSGLLYEGTYNYLTDMFDEIALEEVNYLLSFKGEILELFEQLDFSYNGDSQVQTYITISLSSAR